MESAEIFRDPRESGEEKIKVKIEIQLQCWPVRVTCGHMSALAALGVA